jgi:5,10-methylenetetrahydromethanopterin reductase
MAMRFLLHSFPVPKTVAPLAEIAETDGWDGLVLADSQNLVGDPYSELALAAAVTSRLELGPYVTNPVTRHAAVTASAIATLQAESDGRALLGISRGDSSLVSIGRRRATLEELGRYVDLLQGYLGGRSVEVDGHESRLEWVAGLGLPKVPVDVVATGPRAISVAATHADRVTFAVGASPERIRWAIDVAREARAAAGLTPDSLEVGACVVSATAPSIAGARDLVRANVAIFARFAGQAGAAGGTPEGADRDTERAVADSYDERRHGLQSAGQSKLLPDPFIDRFAIVGTPADCAGRLAELAALGLHHVVVIGPSRDIDHERALVATRRFANEVIPAVRGDDAPPD